MPTKLQGWKAKNLEWHRQQHGRYPKPGQRQGLQALVRRDQGRLLSLTSDIVTIDEKTKQIHWNPEFENGIKEFQRILQVSIETLKTTSSEVYAHRELIFSLVKAYVELKASGWPITSLQRSRKTSAVRLPGSLRCRLSAPPLCPPLKLPRPTPR